MSIKTNPRYLFPAPGWKCFQCSIFEDAPTEFWEVPVVGWGVVEGFDCGEDVCKLSEEACPLTHGSEMQLLVALQDAPLEAPMVYPTSELSSVFGFCAFGFFFNSELTDEAKKALEQKARSNSRPNGKVVA